MAALDTSVKHGQPWDTALANFERGVLSAQAQYGSYIRKVDWAEDRTSARLTGPGFDVLLSVDKESVRASGVVPFFVRLMEGPIRRFVQEAIKSS
jgi:hypothetical protein